MKFPWWWSDNHEKKQTSAELKRRLESTTFATLNRLFCFSVRLPFFRPFLFSSAYVNNYRVCRECVYFKHITETICLEKKKKKKKREKRSVVLLHIRIMTGGGSYDEVDLEDMDWNESLKEFTYSCPCGDIFRITLEELKDGEEIARCPSCSLVLTVIYDPDELPSITNVEAATSGTTEEIA